jgi:hypothetical protein
MKIFEIILGGLVFAFAIFIYFTSRNYSVTKERAISLLRGVLDNTTDWGEWDNFTHIPIKNDPVLEKVRQRLVKLDLKNYFDSKKVFLYDERGMAEIRNILAELETGKAV